MRLGFIGVGIMGKPMTKNLLNNGFQVTVFDINTNAVNELTREGAIPVSSPKEVSQKSDIIFTMLPNGEHVTNVALGENGILEGASKGSIIVDMSSVSPVTSKRIAQTLEENGLEMLDAPVSGGEPKAIDGTLSIMAGGKVRIFEKVKPAFEAMGKDIILVGGNGAGTTAKLANQIMVNVNIAAMSEALILASKAGIELQKMYEALKGGLAGSAVLDAKFPLMLARNFKPGGRIDINAKDLKNVLETAQSMQVPLPLTGHVFEMFNSLQADGKSAYDHCALIQFYEKLASFELEDNQHV